MQESIIKASNLILCERLEIAQFMQCYFKHLLGKGMKLPKLQVFNFKGLDNLDAFIEQLLEDENFSQLERVLIFAEVGPKLNAREMTIIKAEKQLTDCSGLEVNYYLFPGLKTKKRWEFGYLEDALVKALAKDSAGGIDSFNMKNMAEEYLLSVNLYRGKIARFQNQSRHILAAYFAGTEKFAGLRLGEAMALNAFDLDHEVFAPLKLRISDFFKCNA